MLIGPDQVLVQLSPGAARVDDLMSLPDFSIMWRDIIDPDRLPMSRMSVSEFAAQATRACSTRWTASGIVSEEVPPARVCDGHRSPAAICARCRETDLGTGMGRYAEPGVHRPLGPTIRRASASRWLL